MTSKKIYVDTNVFMDFLLDRDPSAYLLFMKTLSCKYYIVISDVVVAELKYQKVLEPALGLMRLLEFNRKLRIEPVGRDDITLAGKLLRLHNTHYNDALHKVVAKRTGAEIFVTKNLSDFKCFTDINVMRPDNL